MRIPGFTASVSLARSQARYVAWRSAGAARALEPQAACFCSEPDFKTVCTSPGHCHEVKVCLQWFCPGRGREIDDDDLAEYIGGSEQ